jgi:hypothetical protein
MRCTTTFSPSKHTLPVESFEVHVGVVLFREESIFSRKTQSSKENS